MKLIFRCYGGSSFFDCFDREVCVNLRSVSAILVAVCPLGAESLGYPCCLNKEVRLQPSSSPVVPPKDTRMAVGPELAGNVDATAGPSIENESLVTAELLRIESVHSSQLNMAPPQVFTRIRLRLLTTDETSGTPHFGMPRDSGMTFEAYTRETVNPDVLGKKIQCKLNCRGDERGGVYGMCDMRALPVSGETSVRILHTFRLGRCI
jgi:hypothetical protein